MAKKLNYKKLYKAMAAKCAALEKGSVKSIESHRFQFDRDILIYYKNKAERLNRENAQFQKEVVPLRQQLSGTKHSAAYLDYALEKEIQKSEEWERRARLMWEWMALLSHDIDLQQGYKRYNPESEKWFE